MGQMATEFLAPPPVAVSLDPAASKPNSPSSGGPRPDRDFHGLKVHGMLGEGGMGAAFLASHKVLRVPLVIKTFKSAAPAQIFREAHLAARVSSPHVVSVLDAGVEDGVPFVVRRCDDDRRRRCDDDRRRCCDDDRRRRCDDDRRRRCDDDRRRR